VRVVFAGTPAAAVPSLRRLIESHHEVIAVITRPDARAGRGRTLVASEVAQLADENGIPTLKPSSASDPEFLAQLIELAPEACPVVAYGALLPVEVLDVPTHGWINLHFSLLPAWRGAAPVQHAIWHGDEITGASTFLLEVGMDTGPVFGVVTAPITPTTTTEQLLTELSHAGAELLARTLDGIEAEALVPVPQPADGVSLAPKITVEMSRISWADPALAIDRMIRASTPAPGAWTMLRDARLKVGPVAPASNLEVALTPGELHVTKRAVFVGTASGPVQLSVVVPQGKIEMVAADWARGLRISEGEKFE